MQYFPYCTCCTTLTSIYIILCMTDQRNKVCFIFHEVPYSGFVYEAQFCEAPISLPSSNIIIMQLLYLQSNPIAKLHDLVKLSLAKLQWHVKLNLRLNHYYYRLCDQRIPCLQGCLCRSHWRSAALSSLMVLLVCTTRYTTTTIIWPFGSGSKAENVHSFKVFEHI